MQIKERDQLLHRFCIWVAHITKLGFQKQLPWYPPSHCQKPHHHFQKLSYLFFGYMRLTEPSIPAALLFLHAVAVPNLFPAFFIPLCCLFYKPFLSISEAPIMLFESLLTTSTFNPNLSLFYNNPSDSHILIGSCL